MPLEFVECRAAFDRPACTVARMHLHVLCNVQHGKIGKQFTDQGAVGAFPICNQIAIE